MLTIYTYFRDRDRELAFKFGIRLRGMCFLALVLWPLGESVAPVVEDAVSQALKTGHAPTLFFVRQVAAYVEMIRGDSGGATLHLEAASVDESMGCNFLG